MAVSAGGEWSASPNKTSAEDAAMAEYLELMESIAIAQGYDEKAIQYFTIGIAGLIAVFTFFQWSRFIYCRYASAQARGSWIINTPVVVARSARRILLRDVRGFASYSHLILVLIYLGINISLTVTNIDWSNLVGVAKRCGWLSLSNMALITLLALKNTPLAFLTSHSYERLNPLHQLGGYTTVTYAILHVILMCTGFRKIDKFYIILEHDQIYGGVAGAGMFIMAAAAIVVRKARYEIFYVTHVTMYIVVVVNIGLHRPDYTLKAAIITTFAGAIWASDRILRGCKLLWNFSANTVTLTPLPHGGTRVVLSRPPAGARPGTHSFLWIPRIRLAETHPFTIVSVTPQSLELVVAARDGFTKELHRHATLHPGAKLRASFDGPYGALPPFADIADKVVLVAGGSGATFTFAVALDMVRRLGSSSKTTIDFVWAVKEHDALSWFVKELSELQSSPFVAIHLYTTRQAPYATSTHLQNVSTLHTSPVSSDEKIDLETQQSVPQTPTHNRNTSLDIEKAISITEAPRSPTPWDSTATLTTTHGRPDVQSLINNAVSSADNSQRVVIAACGPQGLMKAVRRTAADSIRKDGPSIELHCETFGW